MVKSTSRDQYEGFPKEKLYHQALSICLAECESFQASALNGIIAKVNPLFLEGLFEVRCPFVRKLKYIGLNGFDDNESFFQRGVEYMSLSFTGASYTIVGYGERRIGASYFEWID